MRNFLLIGILATVTLMSSCSKDLQESIPTDGEYVIESNDGRLFKSSTSYSKDKIIISNGSTDDSKKVSIRLCYSCSLYGGIADLGEAKVDRNGELVLTSKSMIPYSNPNLGTGGNEKTWTISIKRISEKQVRTSIKVEEQISSLGGLVAIQPTNASVLNFTGTAALQ